MMVPHIANVLCAIELYTSKLFKWALAGVDQWIEHQPVNLRAAGSVPSQGTCLDCRPGAQQRVHERQPQIDVFFPLFLPPFPSLK